MSGEPFTGSKVMEYAPNVAIKVNTGTLTTNVLHQSGVTAMTNTMRLKTRLKLKRLDRLIEEEVEWNFGYCPNTESFNRLMDELTRWEILARLFYPEVYREHEARVYCD